MTRKKIEEYVKNWMDGHEPGTFVKNQHGAVIYTAGPCSLNLEAYFINLLSDYIEESEALSQAEGGGSLKDKLFELANDFAVAKQGEVAAKLHSIHNGLK